jgi:hypothetical protein
MTTRNFCSSKISLVQVSKRKVRVGQVSIAEESTFGINLVED